MANALQTERMAAHFAEKKSPPKKKGGASVTPAVGAETSDALYGLVSVLYHALQGAETYADYGEDAEESGDEELVNFFAQCREEEQERAEQAKSLLASRLTANADYLAEEEG